MFDSRQIKNFYQAMSVGTALDHAVSKTMSATCNPEQAIATAQVVAATDSLTGCLSRENPSLKDVMRSIDDKNIAADRFLNAVGVHWPL